VTEVANHFKRKGEQKQVT